MAFITREEYKEIVKDIRKGYFLSPFELAYESFVKLGYHQKEEDYFRENASDVMDSMRKACWKSFVPIEQQFTTEMLCKLIDDDQLTGKTPREAIAWFAGQYPNHIYDLSLSNTQSRRSRAGKEFEAIIELILIGAGIPLDSQGNIGKEYFTSRGLGKMVDVVSPGAVEYMADKNEVALISAKTTLRERWQEVPEEISRTGAKEMYLVTLDESVSNEVLDTLYDSNVRLTTTRGIKERCYPNNIRVLDMETLVKKCLNHAAMWEHYKYNDDQIKQKEELILAQKEKHSNHPFILNYYDQQLNTLEIEV